MTQSSITRNNVTVTGKGKQPVLFAPGFGFDQRVWATVSKSFEEEFQVISFDYVGFGNSNLTAYDEKKYSNISGYVEDVLAICSDLNLENIIFVGHSVGSMIGLLASIQQPDIFSKLIMIGPSPSFLNEAAEYHGGFEKEELDTLLFMMKKNYVQWTTAIASTIMNGSNQPEIEKGIEDQFRFNNPDITHQFAKVCFFTDYREQLKNVAVPTLMIQSANDLFVPRGVMNYMKENISNSTLSCSTAIGHCPHISHPNEIISLIHNYLNEQSESAIKNTGGCL